jgi:hypothetical protein
MTGRPLLAQGNVSFDALGVRDVGLRIFQQWVEFEADVAIVPLGFLPDAAEYRLRFLDEFVGQRPGEVVILETLIDELFNIGIESPGLDQVGDDHGV